eukprot:GILK01000114.1.p1 GENE.GILK01000114.1~~GILK01000114.1.p1  ORF type:complete len:321 (+),score=38.43 GILK01000114.1:57-965(+)
MPATVNEVDAPKEERSPESSDFSNEEDDYPPADQDVNPPPQATQARSRTRPLRNFPSMVEDHPCLDFLRQNDPLPISLGDNGAVTASEASRRLLNGFRRFKSTYYEEHRDMFSNLAVKGQSPKVMVISCCDSRVDPGIMFDTRPGDLFILRNVANLVPPYNPAETAGYHGTSAALEFAIKYLHVEDIVVMGHHMCGGVKAMISDDPSVGRKTGDFIGEWMTLAYEAKNRSIAKLGPKADPAELQLECEHQTVMVSIDHLLSFPWIADKVRAQTLRLHGWWFDFATADLQWYDQCAGVFKSVV